MTQKAHFVAADLGASSGRIMLGQWDGRAFSVQEMHRFPNGGVRVHDALYWDILGIWSQIKAGLAKYHSMYPAPPQGMAVDAWGVDFGLLDRAGRLVGNPRHYRDSRTSGIPQSVFDLIPEQQWFAENGVQTMPINTLFQLYSMIRGQDPALACAETLLTIPDLCSYFLCGERTIEWSAASTTQIYSMKHKDWMRDFLRVLDVPTRILPEVTGPGTVLSPVRSDVLEDSGIVRPFPVIAVGAHDTASAVLAIPHINKECVFLSSGTWSLMGVEAAEPDTSEQARRLGFTNEGGADGSVLLLKNLTGLWIAQECMRQWKNEGLEVSWSDLAAAAESASPFRCFIDPDAPQFQAPCDMPLAIRQYCRATGQEVPQTTGEIMRCAYESLGLKYRSVLESLRTLTKRPLQTICIVGGGCLNTMLCQMTADACACRAISGPAEASSLGNVMLQAVATGHLPDIRAGRSALASSLQCTTFEPHQCDQWDEAYERFRLLEVNGTSRLRLGSRSRYVPEREPARHKIVKE